MTTLGAGLTVAATLVWLGMVVAISFLEAPLKFTVPGVTLPIGLAIGRKVFRALNTLEGALAVVAAIGLILTARTAADLAPSVVVSVAIAIGALLVQITAVRPALSRRSNEVLAGDGTQATDRRSHAHFYYVGLEVIKVVALVVGSTVALIHG